jgi:hypothetical protein
MHFHRMLIFWLMTTLRGLSCSPETVADGADTGPTPTEMLAAKGQARADSGTVSEPAVPRTPAAAAP